MIFLNSSAILGRYAEFRINNNPFIEAIRFCSGDLAKRASLKTWCGASPSAPFRRRD
jgi:hypothetical protein